LQSVTVVPAREHDVTPLRHAAFLQLRAALLGGAVAFGFWYLARHAEAFLPVTAGLALLVLLGTLWTSRFTTTKLYRLNYLPLPLLLYVSALFFFLLLKNPTYQLGFELFVGLTFWYLFRSFAELREQPSPERKKTFTQALDVISSLTAFLAFASLGQLYAFFSLNTGWLVGGSAVLAALLLYEAFWYHRVTTMRAWTYVALGALVVAQVAWATSLLPVGYLTAAALSVAAFHVFQAVSSASLRGLLHRRLVLEQLAVVGIICAIVLASSRWVPVA
jgi:hypothetical protein